MPKINVLKPFTFTRRVSTGHKIPVERYFPKGFHQIDDDTWAHPFISKYFADGCIETPEQAELRAKGAAEIANRATQEANQAKLFAQQAYDRAVANAKNAKKSVPQAPVPGAGPAAQSLVYSAGAPVPASVSGVTETTEATTPPTEATPTAAPVSTTLTTKQTAKK